MSVQRQYKRGTAIRLDVPIRDIDDELKDPVSIVITITAPDNITVVVDAAAMTRDSIGRYYYIYQSSASAVAGYYDILATAVYGGHTVKKEVLDLFELVS